MMKLVTLGCSFTEKYPNIDKVWPEIVAEKLNADLTNLGKAGSGNRYAYSKLISYILDYGPPDKVYWLLTEFDRVDLIDRSRDSLHSIDYENETQFTKALKNMLMDKDPVHKDRMLKRIKNETKISKVLTQTPIDFLVDSNFILIHQVQEICKSYNIELKIIQGLHPLNYYKIHYDEQKVIKSMVSSKYAKLLDLNTIVGYPFFNIINGFSLCDKDDWQQKYAILKHDPHPSQKGHEYIAELFLTGTQGL